MHGMLYYCTTHMATVGVKGLKLSFCYHDYSEMKPVKRPPRDCASLSVPDNVDRVTQLESHHIIEPFTVDRGVLLFTQTGQ